MFLQGRAGTGKTFTTKALINILKQQNRRVLITGTTGIAASQFKGEETVHSMFRLKIEQNLNNNEIRCNIGLHTFKAEEITTCSLIIIDKVSMMTTQTITGVDITLRYLVSEKFVFKEKDVDYVQIPPFGNIPILFIGDRLQLPPVIPDTRTWFTCISV